jgi:hypothetical protein
MISRDYHHHRLDEALRDAESVVAGVRLTRRSEDAQFIVGHGIIRTELKALLERYGLSPKIQIGNTGVLLCIIE